MSGWRVHWVPNLEGWSDSKASSVATREAVVGILPGSAFMSDPTMRVDPLLTEFFCSAAFTRLADSTRISYTNDYRVLFDFLWGRGKTWAETSPDDMEDFEDWRRRAPANPRTVGGSKWMRELAAFKRLFDWALDRHFVRLHPLRSKTIRTRSGDTIQVLEASTNDVRSASVKWLTPAAFRLWRDVGLRGYTAEGLCDPSWRGRNSDRNAAFADLLFDSGLRRSEAASLLTMELPKRETGRRYQWSRLASAAAKSRRPRAFNMRSETLTSIEAYVDSTRAKAVRHAQLTGTYEAVPDRLVVDSVLDTSGEIYLRWVGPDRALHLAPLNRISPRERLCLYRQTSDGLEPCALWLAEDGKPFLSHSWENVFFAATDRCRRLLGERAPFCTPHMLRHTFALCMLIALMRAMDTRFGLSPGERRDFQLLYGDPWRLVQNLLGHASIETTRDVYLAPVTDLQVRMILEGELDDGADFLSAIALLSGRVLDVTR